MREVFPGTRELTEADVEQLYVYPDGERWLAVNFVSSADGGITVNGRSRALSTPADRVVFGLGSDLADVVLLGAGTAVAEEFEGIHPGEQTAERRRRHGLAPVAPIAVVSTGRSLPPDAPVLTKTLVPTIVITSAATDPELRAAWSEAGAEVIVAGAGDPGLHATTGDPARQASVADPRPAARAGDVDLRAAVEALTARGLRRIDCEGGPHLFASLLAAELVDELRLTVSPMLVAGDAPRVAMGVPIEPKQLELRSMLVEDSSVLLRYHAR
ncbi:riboflavin biosynthesis pyrimidine reductase [Amycolatopsis jiangsuensis]|uniref:Riboflavin biosynthesis pyrimidine reductase n=1 Tax=Amycolatopsis jiangsuensis TaxID=1181879 RepID=A0A840J522_9PSEU|nr:dihydrofolate reductase family protein [Amycolatopsis jiangsuensis]MBB4688923.1 riboflavin biosynthesis pyrimidine reductase [Amycolatopsis jiangsuensis]